MNGNVAVIMPPVTTLDPGEAIEQWTTIAHTNRALQHDGRWQPHIHARHQHPTADVEHNGVRYQFHTSDQTLANTVFAQHPDVIHIHGLGWSRLIRTLRHAVAPIVAQHHGEPVFTRRAKTGHRLVRRHIAGYMFTGASYGQAQPWIDNGVIKPDAKLFEVLEAAAMLPEDGAEIDLEGSPSVLWVGRLIDSKDPIGAIDAFEHANLPNGHLHMLAGERDMEPAVRNRIANLNLAAGRVHLHDVVPHNVIGRWYEAADVFFSTSRREGSGYALIEAMSAGCIPSVCDIPPHKAIVQNSGTTFPPGDIHKAATALHAAATLAASAATESRREQVRQLVSWDTVAQQLADAYDTLANTSRQRQRR